MCQKTLELPTVTVAIPTYNENIFIRKVVQEFLNQEYSNLIEIIVADGGSSDRTQDTVKALAQEEPRVKLIHNPEKFQAFGLNAALQEAQGEVFLRADAHSDYAPDYIERCIEALRDTEAVNVGGAQRFVAKSSFQLGICLASKSILGTGGAKYRDPNYDGYSDTVYLGCFRKKALLEVGGFDVTQITNQDAELNQRLISSYHNAIYVSSKIQVNYYPRSTWQALWIQYFKYGRGRYLTGIKHRQDSQLRGKLPFIVIFLFISVLFVSVLIPDLRLFGVILLFCLSTLPFLESTRVLISQSKKIKTDIWRRKNQDIPPAFLMWLYCGISLLTMPLAHSSGYAYQLLRQQIFRIKDW